MIDINLIDLYKMKNRLLREDSSNIEFLQEILESISLKEKLLLEDTSATGGPAISGGMGAVVSAQPSGLAGATIGQDWASGGGTVGSGDIGVPYNPSGSNRVFQSIPGTRKSREHGGKKGKKLRQKKLDLKALKQAFDRRDKNPTDKSGKEVKKVMDFNDFLKNDFTTIKK
jgi:hypothetical protein